MTITIEKLDHFGRGIAYIEGKVIFIPNALPGEVVEIAIIQNKKQYMLGQINNYIKKSNNREEPSCPFYSSCGGCHLSHMKYSTQLEFKKDTLINILKKYANLDVEPIIISSNEKNYRNKITLKIQNGKWGYYQSESHNFTAINECLLAKDSINNIIHHHSLFNIKSGEIIIRANYNDEIMIIITTSDKVNIDLDKLINNNKIISIIINNNLYYGEEKFMEKVNSSFLNVNYNSFFQVNLEILKEVLNILNEKEYQKVIDLYCGVGTLGLNLNSIKLYGVETASSSIQNAIKNAKINKKEALFILGDSSKIKEIRDNVNTIIIDPPRSGINIETINHIIDKSPEEVIYMSCNAITLARDLKYLKKHYTINKIYLLDMFPQTYHMESLVFLKINQ